MRWIIEMGVGLIFPEDVVSAIKFDSNKAVVIDDGKSRHRRGVSIAEEDAIDAEKKINVDG